MTANIPKNSKADEWAHTLRLIPSIFLLSLLLNLIWEHLHSLLYAGYRGGGITEFILIRASLADAIMITVLALPFVFFEKLKKYAWIIVVAGILLAIGIEWYALSTLRWAYNEFMPIIPILGIGLTPMIQLGLLGYLSYWLVVNNRQ